MSSELSIKDNDFSNFRAPDVSVSDTDINSDLDDEGHALLEGDIDLDAAEKNREKFDQEGQEMDTQEEKLFLQTQETIQKTEQLMDKDDNSSFQIIESSLQNLDGSLPPRGRAREMFHEVQEQWERIQRYITHQLDQLQQTSQDLLNLKSDFRAFNNPELTQREYVNFKLDLVNRQTSTLEETLASIKNFQVQILDMAEGLNRWSEDYDNPFTHDSQGYLNEDGDNINLQMRILHQGTEELPDRMKRIENYWKDLESQYIEFAHNTPD